MTCDILDVLRAARSPNAGRSDVAAGFVPFKVHAANARAIKLKAASVGRLMVYPRFMASGSDSYDGISRTKPK